LADDDVTINEVMAPIAAGIAIVIIIALIALACAGPDDVCQWHCETTTDDMVKGNWVDGACECWTEQGATRG